MESRVTFALFLSAAFCVHAVRPPVHATHRRGGEIRQQGREQADANEEAKRRIARYKTDEGVCDGRAWKEYTANSNLKGEPTLLVVFGGRDSVSRGEGHVPSVPPAIEKALGYVRRQSRPGKLVVLVPEMLVGRNGGAGRRGLENPSADGLAKLIRARADVHGVKPGRIVATGFSMGGGLLLSLLNDDPALFARALVVGASGRADAVADVQAEVMSCHGGEDDLIPVARVKAYAEALCARHPGAMKVEVMPKTGHAESEKAATRSRMSGNGSSGRRMDVVN